MMLRTTLLSLLLTLSCGLFASDTLDLKFTGWEITDSGKYLERIPRMVVTVQHQGAVIYTSDTAGKEVVEFRLLVNDTFPYIISVMSPGYVSKLLQVQSDRDLSSRKGHKTNFDMEWTLFRRKPGLDYSFWEKPVALIRFDPLLEDYSFEPAYSKAMLNSMNEELKRIGEYYPSNPERKKKKKK